jgi:hypothetical protein
MQVLRNPSDAVHIYRVWKGHKFVQIEETEHSAIQRIPHYYV